MPKEKPKKRERDDGPIKELRKGLEQARELQRKGTAYPNRDEPKKKDRE